MKTNAFFRIVPSKEYIKNEFGELVEKTQEEPQEVVVPDPDEPTEFLADEFEDLQPSDGEVEDVPPADEPSDPQKPTRPDYFRCYLRAMDVKLEKTDAGYHEQAFYEMYVELASLRTYFTEEALRAGFSIEVCFKPHLGWTPFRAVWKYNVEQQGRVVYKLTV